MFEETQEYLDLELQDDMKNTQSVGEIQRISKHPWMEWTGMVD